jgi:hypothetical protein
MMPPTTSRGERRGKIVRELANKVDAENAVARLIGAGVAHRLGELTFPTRTTRRACGLQIGTH